MTDDRRRKQAHLQAEVAGLHQGCDGGDAGVLLALLGGQGVAPSPCGVGEGPAQQLGPLAVAARVALGRYQPVHADCGRDDEEVADDRIQRALARDQPAGRRIAGDRGHKARHHRGRRVEGVVRRGAVNAQAAVVARAPGQPGIGIEHCLIAFLADAIEAVVSQDYINDCVVLRSCPVQGHPVRKVGGDQ